ncbi:MAG: lamin tail domain-containing protein, partial [Chloroflexales bacterium]
PAVAAIATGVDIAHIEHNPPGRDIDGEYVLIWNTNDAPMDLTGWTLSDVSANHTFTFPAFTLGPGAEVKLWTKRGNNDEANLHWNSRKAIWNNNGDTGTLKNTDGAVVSVYTYTGKKS